MRHVICYAHIVFFIEMILIAQYPSEMIGNLYIGIKKIKVVEFLERASRVVEAIFSVAHFAAVDQV